ncbi:MAG: hypothetical protein JEZ11_18465 [Desulfobacterales bacterium]|nr:hypothetical protein [Desulfobacterales bacterium]
MIENPVGPQIPSILGSISRQLNNHNVPYALIGAMALSIYGLSRYTSDIDLMCDAASWPTISQGMSTIGFECFQKADAFAQFDAEGGILGRIDIMLIETDEGRAMLDRRVVVADELLGSQPVAQPTDFLILKLMSMANNAQREPADRADISAIFRLNDAGMIPRLFEPLDINRLTQFAERFGQRAVLDDCLRRQKP